MLLWKQHIKLRMVFLGEGEKELLVAERSVADLKGQGFAELCFCKVTRAWESPLGSCVLFLPMADDS